MMTRILIIFQHCGLFALSYLDDLDRVCGPEYIPSEQDVLRARAATQGLLEHKFLINKTAFT